VNGLVTGDMDSAVLRDRKSLSRDGVVVVTATVNTKSGKLAGKPRIITQGFIDIGENQALIEKSQEVVAAVLNHDRMSLRAKQSDLDARVRDSLGRFLYEQVHRRPIIIPVIEKY